MARVPEVALRAISVGTQVITLGQRSPDRNKSTKSSCSPWQLMRCYSQRYFIATLHWLFGAAVKVRRYGRVCIIFGGHPAGSFILPLE
ncbi:hypothetical protein GDO81_028474 [Engystomops pustulosus]|uniref:Uncharacterized protein n=1 Tax=Engystomops pustulosus TaxID=76066 RepID=A0AAV6YFH3_ENGPU|nr:hypothetical protein GDO81_028474 [Engystomops pustulosus]